MTTRLGQFRISCKYVQGKFRIVEEILLATFLIGEIGGPAPLTSLATLGPAQ